MVKKLIFHLGYHKSGSSAIQRWLLEHRDSLAKHLFCYNLADGSSNPLKLAVHRFIMGQIGSEQIRVECRKMRVEINSCTQPVVCYSDEGLLGPPLGFRNGSFFESKLYPYAREVIAILVKEFADFSPVFYAMEREPEAWLKSMHNQMAKQGCVSNSLKEFSSAFGAEVNWPALRKDLVAGCGGLGEVVITNFEDEFGKTDIQEMSLFRLLDIPADVLRRCDSQLKHINKSVPLSSEPPGAANIPSLSEDTIILAYRLFLERTPAAREVESMQRNAPDIPQLRRVILNSPEFNRIFQKIRE